MQPAMVVNGPERHTDWQGVNWRTANKCVRNLRQRIFRATREGDWRTVQSLQKLMLRSYANTLLSVRRVTQVNQGKRTPGVDKVVIKTPPARGRLVDYLMTSQPWRARPARRVYIPKATGTQRPLGIPTILDRCLQARVKNALGPSWEARFEGISYGFRPGRSGHDAIEKIHRLARPHTRKKWVVDADIKGAFDHLDHTHLLETIGPVPGRELVKQWLKAGYVDTGAFGETDAGTPQGGVISPLLANIALQGMEGALGVKHDAEGHIRSPRAVVRYADDFVVFCESREDAETVIDILIGWLKERGLHLSPEKTRIVHLTEGFDFLGFTIRRCKDSRTPTGWKLRTTPSKASVQRLRDNLRAAWRNLKGYNAAAVCKRLNPIIRGWGHYHRVAAASRTSGDLDHWMCTRACRWMKSSHPSKPKRWTRSSYFGEHHPERTERWVFGDHRTGTHPLKFQWLRVRRHPLVKGTASPDDPRLTGYWKGRMAAHASDLIPSMEKLSQRQGHVCPRCAESLFNGEEVHKHHVHHQGKGGPSTYENLRLVHLYCHQQEHRSFRADARDLPEAETEFAPLSDVALEPDAV